jgi:hypothetical protein
MNPIKKAIKKSEGELFKRITGVDLYTEPIGGVPIALEKGLYDEVERFNEERINLHSSQIELLRAVVGEARNERIIIEQQDIEEMPEKHNYDMGYNDALSFISEKLTQIIKEVEGNNIKK